MDSPSPGQLRRWVGTRPSRGGGEHVFLVIGLLKRGAGAGDPFGEIWETLQDGMKIPWSRDKIERWSEVLHG